MKNIYKNVPKMMWKGKVTLICFFLFAGCMLHDESLTPSNRHDDVLSDDLNTESADRGHVKKATRIFTAHLRGANEVPPVDSKGIGQAIFVLSKDGTQLHYKLLVANIKNVTQAHIHCGATGVNGPVVVFLFGFATGGVTKNGVIAEGTITSANIIARPDSEACMGGLATFENLLERMRNGTAYVNAHTVAYPGGEIRGQVKNLLIPI